MMKGNVPEEHFEPRASAEGVAAAVTSALFLSYSAPMPGGDSRYSDSTVAHETRLLGGPALAAAISRAGERSVGETVLEAVLGARSSIGYADFRAAGYLTPLARAALLGEHLKNVLARLSHGDARLFSRALEVDGSSYPAEMLARALNVTLGAGRDATLRDAMRFAADRDPMAREYARNFEVTRDLARPALSFALARVEATRPALVQAYLEVLAEVPDLDAASRAGYKEAEEVSRMARGVLKSGGVYSRRGLQAVANLDGLLRSKARLKPSATEHSVTAAAFLLALKRGPKRLNERVRPAPRT